MCNTALGSHGGIPSENISMRQWTLVQRGSNQGEPLCHLDQEQSEVWYLLNH